MHVYFLAAVRPAVVLVARRRLLTPVTPSSTGSTARGPTLSWRSSKRAALLIGRVTFERSYQDYVVTYSDVALSLPVFQP